MLLPQELAKDLSLISPGGYQTTDCGYCNEKGADRTPDSGAAYYARSSRLTVDDYQELMDRGWRRSGATLYKTDQRRACCPQYTIRLPVAEFKPSRDQRQTLHKWNRFVLGEDYLNAVKQLYPLSKEEKKKSRNEFELQQAVHESEYENLKQPPEPQHRFEVTLEWDNYTEEKYVLFEQYQRLIHKERPSDISKRGFKTFLCSSPLLRKESGEDPPVRLGSYHQCYRLDGKLIALGVVDHLPRALSAVYFIYDVEYEKFSFGKLSALREACMALEGGYEFYYMGYYIHSCVKMRYKGDYRPQYILDPGSNVYYPLDDDVKAKLDKDKYLSLSRQEPSANSSTRQNKNDGRLMYGSPVEAFSSGLTAMELQVPGVMSIRRMKADVALDKIFLGLKERVLQTEDHPLWRGGSVTGATSFKRVVGELAACVGPVVANRMIFDATNG